MRSILVCIALIAFAILSVNATTLPCSSMSPPPIQSNCCSPIQVVFVMDNSVSVTQADLKKAYRFAKQFRCSFPAAATNLQLGMVSFNSEVKVIAPLQMYTETEWYTQVDTARNSSGHIPQSKYTPMAEAFQLTRQVFADANANRINPNCTAKAIPVQRVAVVFTDGNPAQNVNTPNVAGYTAFPTAWRVVNQDSGVYAEVTVPAQAKLLKDDDVGIIFAGLDVTTENLGMQPGYFAGELVESRKCQNVTVTKGFSSGFCANKLGNPANLTHQSINSQCYLKRDTLPVAEDGDGIGKFMDPTLAGSWVCKFRNPNSNDFPIASLPSDVLPITPTGSPTFDLTSELLSRVVPAICPNSCFLA